ncbi:hypothetical protein CA601_34700 [Paraburkholderia hospita]|nr:hypothetical protein CA601_34700 [Paraburkholderia hospita]OUL85079.1 hypothetical protein CA603_23820 [Paraburkholderia hospita]
MATQRHVATLGTLMSLVMVGLSALVLYQSRRDAEDYTRADLRNIALIAQRDIDRNFSGLRPDIANAC